MPVFLGKAVWPLWVGNSERDHLRLLRTHLEQRGAALPSEWAVNSVRNIGTERFAPMYDAAPIKSEDAQQDFKFWSEQGPRPKHQHD